jgi:general secretion pathway protein H
MISGHTARTDNRGEKVKTRTSPTGREPVIAGGGISDTEQAFSLLELLVVLALMTLFLGLVVPSMYQSWRREQDRASLRQMVATFRTARSVAATKRQRVRVFVDLTTGNYRLEGSSQTGQLSGIRLTEAHLVWQDPERRRGYIAFYADGSSSGGHLAMVGPARQRQVLEVETVTGKVLLKAGG